MAPPANNPAFRRAEQLLRLLAPFPGRLEFAARLALICALTALIAEIYQTPEPALTVYVAFFLVKPDRVSSIILSLLMLTVLSVTLALILLATMQVADQPVWRVGTMAVLSFGLVFLGSASKLRPIAPTLALIAAYALDLLGSVRLGEIATRALLYAWLFVAIPVGMSIIVNLLLGPPPRRLAERALAQLLHLTAAMLHNPAGNIETEFQAALHEGVDKILAWLQRAGLESTSTKADLAALRQATGSTLRLMQWVNLTHRIPQIVLGPDARLSLAKTLEEMSEMLRAGAYPVDIEWRVPEGINVPPLAQALRAEIESSLGHFAVPPTHGSELPAVEEPRAGFFAADAFTNPEHVRHALKTTGAAMLCYILYSLLDWPGIHTCLITCYIVSLGTAAETVEKLGLRILGCILGAAAGIAAIIILVPALTSVGALIIMVFLAAFVSAWVAGGDPRIAYAGFQMAFAFFLCVIQGAGPSFDMVNARDRVIGILLGDVVVYLIFTNVWPVSVVERIDPAITAVLGKLGGLLAANRISAALTASATQTALAGLERDLDLAAYEPVSIRPVSEWLEQRWQAAADLRALEPMFLLCAAQDPKLAQDIAARLRRFGGTAPAASPGGNLTSPLVALRGPIEALLQSLEHWQSAPDKDEAVANAAVSRAGLVGRPRAKRDSNTKGHSQ